ncbi:methyltransferase domain-containing protein [Candidatus Woesearchaeota archaeon]|jgi:SAM-dependent methyltransferase|nr:methyltransferase domain-containing protein [Candidatus Woesearchaeota archaeon]MBT6518519.1 methyltransferase domain-containing protein [Candidatus Woesearchaeota archaeon]MBT7368391.1 methyltransferase domain-containing protein [Candidatus Woesearchaeota archaeon]
MTPYKQYWMNKIPFEDIDIFNICGSNKSAAVSYWAPRREEIQRFVEIAKVVNKKKLRPKILDVGCGTGFLAYLLAKTGEVDVVGLDSDKELTNNNPFAHPNLKLEVGDASDAVKRYRNQDFDTVICSWMPYQINLTPDVRAVNAKSIVYIKERGGATGCDRWDYEEFIYEPGFSEFSPDAKNHRTPNPVRREDAVSFDPGLNYKSVLTWSGPAHDEVKIIIRRLNGEDVWTSEKNYNVIEVQIRNEIPKLTIPKINIIENQKYVWESALENYGGVLDELHELEKDYW